MTEDHAEHWTPPSAVVVVGSINQDVAAKVHRIPRPGETILASEAILGSGGKGANQAVAVVRAGGTPCSFVGAVGDDQPGIDLRNRLQADGVDTSGVSTVRGSSGMALIAVDRAGENAITVVPGSNGTMENLSEQQRALVSSARVVLAQLEIPVSAVLDAARSRAAGSLFVLNAAPSSLIVDESIATDLLTQTDVLIVNQHELRDIARIDSVDLAASEIAERVPALVVTLGADGAIVAFGSERRSVSAYAADAQDTTGAGDTFCGTLAAFLASHEGELSIDLLVAAAQRAAAAAALSVARPGAQDGIPTVSEVDRLLASGNL